MDVRIVDTCAVLGSTPLHRAGARSKIAATLLLVAAVVVASDPVLVAGVALGIVTLATALGLPVARMLPFAAYPALLAALFAVASAPGPVSAALIVLKAITAALSVVLLLFTTPYPQVFAPLQRVLPSLVGDALFMTYRSLFILGERFDDLVRAARLRSGISGRRPIASARALTRALGGLLLYALDLAQREYDILAIRGYDRRLRVPIRPSRSPVADVCIVTASLAALVAGVAIRLQPACAAYTWVLPAMASVALTVTAIVRSRNR